MSVFGLFLFPYKQVAILPTVRSINGEMRVTSRDILYGKYTWSVEWIHHKIYELAFCMNCHGDIPHLISRNIYLAVLFPNVSWLMYDIANIHRRFWYRFTDYSQKGIVLRRVRISTTGGVLVAI